MHTQNIKPTWNVGFEFQFLNGPGQLKNANATTSGIRLTSGFATKDRRYSGVFIYITNRNRSSQNGGIVSDTFLTSSNPAYDDRFNIPTWLGGDGQYGTNFFSTSFTVGTDYKSKVFMVRHQYDLGKRDSVLNVEDSTYTKIFYPRLRLQHLFSLRSSSHYYSDQNTTNTAYNDASYRNHFGITLTSLPLQLRDRWRDITNEGALILFPDKQNQEQFLKVGAGIQLLQGEFGTSLQNFENTYMLGEYRNRTRNRKWDINANARLYATGLNSGDYSAAVSLQANLKPGSLRVGFNNTNRTPSFVFDTRSNFFLEGTPSFAKENWTVISGDLYTNKLGLHLTGRYFLISNYTYWTGYYQASQEATLQSVLHVGAEKKFKLSRHWNWYAELHVQQSTGDAINLPLAYTRNRIAYEGVFYKNLNLSTGVEFRYNTPFTPDDWSPFNGQWVTQNTTTISNLPDIAAFLHIRIRGFRAFVRAENLNTLDVSRGFQFINNNVYAPLYPAMGFLLRLGIYWSFVN
jgi:hypothetical protein